MINTELAKEVMLMVHKYVATGADFTDTPENCWLSIRDSVLRGDLDSILILLEVGDRPAGFLFCTLSEKDAKMAIVNGAYLGVKGHTKEIVAEAMEMFEKWAVFMNADRARFYTFRVPGAHKLMERRGWSHTLTVYSKEL
jgi:hypothetical protein